MVHISQIYIYIYMIWGNTSNKNPFRSTGSCEGYNYDWNIYIGRFNHKQCKIVNLLSAFGFPFVRALKKCNVVYLISCCKCQKQYVGETKGLLNLRMNGHRDDWKHCRFERSPVAEHFRSTEHDFLKHASVCCIVHSPEWTDSTRKSRECYWIRRPNTLRPHGINKND